jgi:AcrR family transcriptional regulator
MPRRPSKTARDKLLRATAELLVEQGISGVSVEAVARRSGVAKTTLYRHFGGIDGLVFAAVAESVREAPAPDTVRKQLRSSEKPACNREVRP